MHGIYFSNLAEAAEGDGTAGRRAQQAGWWEQHRETGRGRCEGIRSTRVHGFLEMGSAAERPLLIQGVWMRPEELDVHTLRGLAMAPLCVPPSPQSLNSSARQSMGSSASSISGARRVGSGGETVGLKELCGSNFGAAIPLHDVRREDAPEDLIFLQL